MRSSVRSRLAPGAPAPHLASLASGRRTLVVAVCSLTASCGGDSPAVVEPAPCVTSQASATESVVMRLAAGDSVARFTLTQVWTTRSAPRCGPPTAETRLRITNVGLYASAFDYELEFNSPMGNWTAGGSLPLTLPGQTHDAGVVSTSAAPLRSGTFRVYALTTP